MRQKMFWEVFSVCLSGKLGLMLMWAYQPPHSLLQSEEGWIYSNISNDFKDISRKSPAKKMPSVCCSLSEEENNYCITNPYASPRSDPSTRVSSINDQQKINKSSWHVWQINNENIVFLFCTLSVNTTWRLFKLKLSVCCKPDLAPKCGCLFVFSFWFLYVVEPLGEIRHITEINT